MAGTLSPYFSLLVELFVPLLRSVVAIFCSLLKNDQNQRDPQKGKKKLQPMGMVLNKSGTCRSL